MSKPIDSYIISPKTGRSIRVGGTAYRKLLREQNRNQQNQDMLDGRMDNIAEPQYETLSDNEVEPPRNRKKKKYGKSRTPVYTTPSERTENPNRQSSKRTKKELNYLDTQEVQRTGELSAFASKHAINALKNNMSDVVNKAASCKNNKDISSLESHLQQLILEEMLAEQSRNDGFRPVATKESKPRADTGRRRKNRYEVQKEYLSDSE